MCKDVNMYVHLYTLTSLALVIMAFPGYYNQGKTIPPSRLSREDYLAGGVGLA